MVTYIQPTSFLTSFLVRGVIGLVAGSPLFPATLPAPVCLSQLDGFMKSVVLDAIRLRSYASALFSTIPRSTRSFVCVCLCAACHFQSGGDFQWLWRSCLEQTDSVYFSSQLSAALCPQITVFGSDQNGRFRSTTSKVF